MIAFYLDSELRQSSRPGVRADWGSCGENLACSAPGYFGVVGIEDLGSGRVRCFKPNVGDIASVGFRRLKMASRTWDGRLDNTCACRGLWEGGDLDEIGYRNFSSLNPC